ncbi:MAG TPA: hydroxymethylbilane synthase, partial [Polyangiaceae bacterium]|nr:hydroxymethylbilane synthase [Polyangiaceae bacterium]
MTTQLTVATRKSALALAQTRAFMQRLRDAHPGLELEELHIVTTGDRVQDRALSEIGGKGLFIKEIEEALLDGRADVAVHSIKDVPAELAPGSALGCIPSREDA